MRALVPFEEPGDIGFVYFIQCENTGPIKIGFTKDIKKRFYGMQTGNPFKLNMLFNYRANRQTEEMFHEWFRGVNVRGEWFWPTPKLLEMIEECKAWEKDRVYKDPISHSDDLMTKRQWLSLVRYRKSCR